MSWALGYDPNWRRWVGYSVPAWCDYPGCSAVVDRGLAYVCGNEPMGGAHGCGLYFCEGHLAGQHNQCPQCITQQEPYDPKPEHPDWLRHVLIHESWAGYREENPETVKEYQDEFSRNGLSGDAGRG